MRETEESGEIRTIAQARRDHAEGAIERDRNATTILLGDFNIHSPEDATFEAIEEAGFVVDERLQSLPTNVGKDDHHYDQIAMYDWEWAPDIREAGVLDLYDVVYRDEDEELYADRMGKMYTHKSDGEERPADGGYDGSWYYRVHWRTRLLSDHLPMWVELGVDQSEEWLETKT